MRWVTTAIVLFGLGGVATAGDAPAVTFNKDIAPVLWKNCAACHRPGEVAPFSLLTYKDAAKRADQLVEATASRVMPPWKAEPGHGEFKNERRLTAAELELLAAWAKAGAPEGEAKDLPPAPTFPDGWALGKPDLVVKMPAPIEVPAEGRDIFRVIPLQLPPDQDLVLAAVDFHPGNRKVVHHALIVVDNVGLMRDRGGPAVKAEAQPPRPVVGQLLAGQGMGNPINLLGAWAPGSMPQYLPDGHGMKIPKGSRVVLQLHYHSSGKAETDQSEVAFYFAKKPDPKPINMFMMAGFPLNIPPGEKRHTVKTAFTLPVEMTVVSIAPHMHVLGREMKVTATLPDGKPQPLVWLKDWDWNWQGSYQYKQPVTLPKGTKLDLVAYYDNSTGNPANPNSPPKAVRWGEQTTDEMCLCFFQITTPKDEDIATLRRAMVQQRLQEGMGPKKDK